MKHFSPQLQPPKSYKHSIWFIFKGEEILLHTTADLIQIPESIKITEWDVEIRAQQYLGIYGETHCFAMEIIESTSLPLGMEFYQLRKLHELLKNEDLFLLAGRAKQILHWDTSTQFCGYCGNSTNISYKERAKICSNCNTLIFPNISPVVMVLIKKEKQILLARSHHFVPGIYSVLAGFVEPGETVEEAAHREVLEEVGIKIKNLSYFASQAWPFPSNLMLGFFAEYESGEIQIDPIEIEDAQWFPVDKLPAVPQQMSLARWLIDKSTSH